MQDAGYELPRTPAFHALRCIAFSLRCSGSIYTLGTQAMGPAFRSLYMGSGKPAVPKRSDGS
jgi:hypothetical protein